MARHILWYNHCVCGGDEHWNCYSVRWFIWWVECLSFNSLELELKIQVFLFFQNRHIRTIPIGIYDSSGIWPSTWWSIYSNYRNNHNHFCIWSTCIGIDFLCNWKYTACNVIDCLYLDGTNKLFQVLHDRQVRCTVTKKFPVATTKTTIHNGTDLRRCTE